ncbi:MAG: translation initiation factor eIF-2B [Patescibacteria group bacterium]
MNINKKFNQTIQDIKSIKIQGATAVTRAGLLLLADYALFHYQKPNFIKKIKQAAIKLASARPTEPLARNLINYYTNQLIRDYKSGKLKRSSVKSSVSRILSLITQAKKKIFNNGTLLIKTGDNIFTHCHSSLTEGILVCAKQKGKKFKVYHTETRPLYQGHITDKHLSQYKIPTVMVVDSAAAFLVSNWSGDDIKINKVILGADSIATDGSVFNKVGSFAIALAAVTSGIPVYIAATLLKLDSDKKSKIEMRDGRELWPQAPKGTKVLNYAFDKIPTRLISGFITEAGIIKPKQVKSVALKFYPWLRSK